MRLVFRSMKERKVSYLRTINSPHPHVHPFPFPLYLWRVLTQSQWLSVFLILSVGPGENPALSSSSGSLSEGQGEKPSLSLTYCFPSPPQPTAAAPLLPPLPVPWLLSALLPVPVGKINTHVVSAHVHSGYMRSDMSTPEAGSEAQRSAGCLWLTHLEGRYSQRLFGGPLC